MKPFVKITTYALMIFFFRTECWAILSIDEQHALEQKHASLLVKPEQLPTKLSVREYQQKLTALGFDETTVQQYIKKNIGAFPDAFMHHEYHLDLAEYFLKAIKDTKQIDNQSARHKIVVLSQSTYYELTKNDAFLESLIPRVHQANGAQGLNQLLGIVRSEKLITQTLKYASINNMKDNEIFHVLKGVNHFPAESLPIIQDAFLKENYFEGKGINVLTQEHFQRFIETMNQHPERLVKNREQLLHFLSSYNDLVPYLQNNGRGNIKAFEEFEIFSNHVCKLFPDDIKMRTAAQETLTHVFKDSFMKLSSGIYIDHNHDAFLEYVFKKRTPGQLLSEAEILLLAEGRIKQFTSYSIKFVPILKKSLSEIKSESLTLPEKKRLTRLIVLNKNFDSEAIRIGGENLAQLYKATGGSWFHGNTSLSTRASLLLNVSNDPEYFDELNKNMMYLTHDCPKPTTLTEVKKDIDGLKRIFQAVESKNIIPYKKKNEFLIDYLKKVPVALRDDAEAYFKEPIPVVESKTMQIDQTRTKDHCPATRLNFLQRIVSKFKK